MYRAGDGSATTHSDSRRNELCSWVHGRRRQLPKSPWHHTSISAPEPSAAHCIGEAGPAPSPFEIVNVRRFVDIVYSLARGPSGLEIPRQALVMSLTLLQPVSCMHLLNSLYSISSMVSTPFWPSCCRLLVPSSDLLSVVQDLLLAPILQACPPRRALRPAQVP